MCKFPLMGRVGVGVTVSAALNQGNEKQHQQLAFEVWRRGSSS